MGKWLIAVVLLAGACSGGDDESAAETPESACVRVTAESLLEAIAAQEAAAVESDDQLGNGSAWYVSTPEGGTWVTNGDPAGEGGGLVLPLNQQARDSSDTGADVAPDAPVWGDVSATAPEASESRDCANGVG